MGDLTGLGEPLGKLIDAVRAGLGVAIEPHQIRRLAKAHAEEIRLLSRARAEAELEADAIQRGAALPVSATGQEFADRMQQRIRHQETRRQANIESVVGSAAEAMPEHVSPEMPEKGWLTRFFANAADVDDSLMRDMWGKILAGELASPGQFSLRTLEVMRNLSQHEAQTFVKACQLVSGGNESVMLFPGKPPMMLPDDNEFAKFLSYSERLLLADAGLLHLDALVWTFAEFPALVFNNGKNIEISEIPEVIKAASATGNWLSRELPVKDLPVLQFTEAGRAIGSLVPDNFNEPYFNQLAAAYEPWGLRMRLVP